MAIASALRFACKGGRLARLVLASLFIAFLVVCVISSVAAKSPFSLSGPWWAVVTLSTLAGVYLAHADTVISGVVVAAVYAVVLSLGGPVVRADVLLVFAPGALLGALFLRQAVLSSAIAGALLLGICIGLGLFKAFLFFLSFGLMVLVGQYSHYVYLWLLKPFRRLRSQGKTLLAFLVVYLAVVLFFALIFKTFYHAAPEESFVFSAPQYSDDMVTYVYLSISCLNSSPPAEVSPKGPLAKSLVMAESTAGLFLLVIFIHFILNQGRGEA